MLDSESSDRRAKDSGWVSLQGSPREAGRRTRTGLQHDVAALASVLGAVAPGALPNRQLRHDRL